MGMGDVEIWKCGNVGDVGNVGIWGMFTEIHYPGAVSELKSVS